MWNQRDIISLSNTPIGIPKNIFIDKSLENSMLSDYLRAETMMSYLSHKEPLARVPYLSSNLNVSLYAEGKDFPILIFNFSNRVSIKEDIGVMGESIENINKFIVKTANKPVQVNLSCLKVNNSLIDVFDWIANSLSVLAHNEKGELRVLIEESYEKIYNGNFQFRRFNESSVKLDQTKPLEDIVEKGYDLILGEL